MSDIAILHDQINTNGGAERVAFELARTFDAPIYSGWVDDSKVPADVDAREVFTSRVAQLPPRIHYMAEDAYQMVKWQRQPELTEYDTLIINKTNPAWFIPEDDQSVVWYLHSTPRNLYDLFHINSQGLAKSVLSPIMRSLYLPNIRRCDYLVCNSELVARRAELYWDRDADAVVHPPVDVSAFGADEQETRGYYLTLSRLERHKRTAKVVQAANTLGIPLKVAGTGTEYDRLQELAGPTVELCGYVSEERKQELMSGAKAFVMAADNEDFGMTPIEAMASGTPVIGVDDGFTKHQVLDGQNGLLFEKGSVGDAITRFERAGVEWSDKVIEDWTAQNFGTEKFRNGMQEAIDTARERAAINPAWEEAA